MLFLFAILLFQCKCYSFGNSFCSSMSYINKILAFCDQNPTNSTCNHTQNNISLDLLFSDYNKILSESQRECGNNSNNSIACTFMANYCLLLSESTEYCNQFRGMLNEYSCIIYQQSYREILRETTIPQEFDYSSIIKIVLAVFSPTGEFIGYSPLKKEIQNCWSPNYQGNIWRKFGRNYYEKCSLNISQLSLNFYEPYLYIDDQDLLIQIPVLPTNYVQNGVKVNDEDGIDANYQFLNRFFLYDNYSTKKNQYASEISFILKIREEDHKKIHVPYLSVKYNNIYDSNVIQSFKFSAKYILSNTFFTTLSIIVLIISAILAISYFVALFFFKLRSLVSDGTNQYVVFSIVASLFDSIGSALFLACFFLGFFILCGYKWTNHLFMCLSPKSNYYFIIIIVFISLIFKLIGIILIVINQSRGTLQVIDWDERSSIYNYDSQSQFLARYRQNVAANEWLKLSTVRGIDTPFIIIFVLLIIRGCKMYLLQQPIPTTEKIDVGEEYQVIEIGLSSFTWLLTTFIFWLCKRFIYWNVFGDPFRNFQQLCLNLNISALMMMCNTRGFLIHGKQTRKSSPLSQITNNYDYKATSDPEWVKNDDYDSFDDGSTYSDETEQSTKSKNRIKLYINNDSEEPSTRQMTTNDSNSDQTEPEKIKVDLNDTNENQVKMKEKKASHKSYTINQEKQIIDQDKKDITDVGMDNIDPDPVNKPNNSDKKNKKSSNSNDESDEDIEIEIDSNSEKTNNESSNGKNSHDAAPKKRQDPEIEIEEEEEEIEPTISKKDEKENKEKDGEKLKKEYKEEIDIKKDEKLNHEGKEIKKSDSEIIILEEEEEISESTDSKHKESVNHENDFKNKHDMESSSSIKISDDSEHKDELPEQILKAKENFDSNVVNDNDNELKASKYVKKFTFHPVNLLKEEEESENEEESYFSDVEIISDSHSYSVVDISNDTTSEQKTEIQEKPTPKTPSVLKKKKKQIHDTLPKLDPLDKKYKGNNQVFEIFLDPDFFGYVNKNEELIDILIKNDKNKIYSQDIKSIVELNDETNVAWCQILDQEETEFQYLIEVMSMAQSIFKIGPSAMFASVFTIQKDSSFKESMLYGVEGSLIIFYLILFVSIEIIFNASVAGLIVFLVDALIVKLFKWKRRKYLINHEFSPYKSLVR